MIQRAVPAAAGAVLLAMSATSYAWSTAPAAVHPSGWTLAQDDEAEDDFLLAEGALQNDVFVPGNETAEKELATGDEALERVSPEEAQTSRDLRLAFDAWHRALLAARTGEDSVRPRGGSAPNRTRIGCDRAVLLRIAALEVPLRQRWTERFAEPARIALTGSGNRDASLAHIAYVYPATPAAVQACLRLGDLASERGSEVAARGFYERAVRQLEIARFPEAESQTSLEGAANIRLQRQAARSSAGPSNPVGEPAGQAGSWRSASGLASIGVLPFDSSRGRGSFSSRRREYRGGVRPGATEMMDGRIVLQTADRVIVVSATGRNLSHRSFSPGRLTEEHFGRPDPPSAPPIAPGWPLLPAAGRDRAVILVDGRASPGSGEPNTLLCVELPPAGDTGLSVLTGEALPRLRWAVWGSVVVGPEGEAREEPALAPFEAAEFQPGPVVVGETVVVQVRLLGGDVEAWALGFSLSTGEVLWRRFLAKGSDIGRTERRLQRGPILAGQPLLAAPAEGQVYVGTHLGALAALDAWDGSLLWSHQNRRRSAPQAGFSGARPLPASAGIAWAPADSDRAYLLEGGPLAHLDADPVAALHPIGPASLVLEIRPEGRLAQARAGRERTLSWLPAQGERHDAIYLSQDERFVGRGLASAERALLPSDRGLYLFDRSRDLYLLDYLSIPEDSSQGRIGGDLFGFGPLLVLVGPEAAWFVATE